ncbi:hypothetical protein wVul_1710 [Wolbachia endosymbiont of Armadillidium vulgare str. wVulC]|uniref:Uncharacterized protein n=1 Tax=Wolbachia endosymbiont of Armadillidium arcangelii TaxID=3158571 RepID=A0AAU7Q1K1_9RICK|nr:hypothetical protein [Wolbachia endosymbiont of Armadillidium vulgare]KLT21965.1 hypothetical protein wVul_1710 [Wolbachia endosymbiont of Armadillidium vulgare str. wVulC]
MKEAKGKNNKSPVVRLKATAKEFNFSKLRADQDNELANSGETMFLDFQRMNFIINGKEIDKNLIIAFKEGAKDYKNEIFNRDNFDNLSEEGKAFMEPALKELDQDRLSEVWENHCNSPTVADEKKIDEYRKEFERFYNAGRSSYHLFSKKDYRALAKEIFKKMFRYAEAEVPSDAILEELVTNCNQAGYGAGIFNESHAALSSCNLTPHSPKKALNIYCTDHNCIKVKSDMAMPITTFDNPEEKICDLSSSLEFTLESRDGKDVITYKEGKLSLTIPEELKNYKDNGKSLFDIIKEYFETFCAKLGFKHETKIQIEHDLGTQIKVSNYLDGTISTTGSDANEEFINLLRKNLRGRLLGSGVALEDVNDFVAIKVSTAMDLLSDYAKLEDNKENRELLISEVADNLGISSQDKEASGVIGSLPSLIKGQVNHNQVQCVVNIFTNLIIEGKSEIYEKKGAVNAIHQKVDKAIVEQDIGNDNWTDKIKKQRLSMESHEHLH